ncbi:MAG TPA: hypothetical protein IAC39_01315 [Candidatus Faeciplasma pullistercoris]|uniref:DUF6472 domain-containing protein n=1 Tax=Candidatus Faeciplasma pullistercoris TaxID=2840800 RepID=A0A9D1GSS9_9FIRM|nr:hypothetical protein [Candidatus Faeciplasma pullistercoris]
MTVKGKKALTNCETCSHYVYDEDYDQYTCEIDLDEDEMARFLSGAEFDCSYYQLYDEYGIVRRQNGL